MPQKSKVWLRETENIFKMKFRFCGDLDCPDWLLAEISILSKLSSIRMKQLCVEVVKTLLGNDINYQQVEKSAKNLEESDVKAIIAALSFILSSAAKHAVDGSSLDNELQQLGLPKENVSSLCKVYADSMTKLQDAFRAKSLRTSKLESVEWRVDCVLSSSALQNICEPKVHLKLSRRDPVTGEVTPLSFALSGDKFRLLLKDLKQASVSMDNLA